MANDRPFPTNNFDFDEEDDISDSLSPSDGYFSGSSQVPQNYLVVDPTTEEDSSRGKAREAAEESASAFPRYRSITPPASPQFTRNSAFTPSSTTPSEDGRSIEEYRDEYARLQHDPPPLYEAATAGQGPIPASESSPLSPAGSLAYDTMSQTPFRDHSAQPQSMADDPGDMYEDEEAAIQRQRRGWFDRRSSGGRFRRFVVTMIFVLFGLWLIFIVLSGIQSGARHTPLEHQHEHVAPVLPANPSHSPSATPSTKPSAIHSDIPSTTPSSAPKPDPPSPSSEPYEPPKETWIIRDHSSVSGRYTLYDLLYIRSITGSISIEIEIPSDWNERSRPSVVDIATSSGSVSINYVDAFGRSIGRTGIFGSNEGDDGSEEIYFSKSSSSSASTRQRTLVSSVSSKTGGISGHFLHGNQTTYKTETGSISGTFYPIGPVSEDSYLSTSTTSGSTSLTITDPLQRRQMSNADRTQVYHLENLYSYHTTYASGSATLKYPGTWSGTVEIKTDGSGSRKASGTGLHIIEETPNRIVASRGHAKGTAVIHQYGSGSVTFTCAGLMDTIRGMWQGGNDKAGKAGDKEFEGVMGWLVWMMEEAIDSLDRVQGDKEMETENLNDLNAGDME